MKISVILAHPNKGSFNHAIAANVVEALNQNGHEVGFHDLYEERFDPILPFQEIPKDVPLPFEIENYCGEIAEAEGIVIIHPSSGCISNVKTFARHAQMPLPPPSDIPLHLITRVKLICLNQAFSQTKGHRGVICPLARFQSKAAPSRHVGNWLKRSRRRKLNGHPQRITNRQAKQASLISFNEFHLRS